MNFLSDIPNLSHIHQLSVTYFGDFETYFCPMFHFTSTKNNILLLDSSPNENYDVSFAPHKITEYHHIFGIYQRLSLNMTRNP